MSVMCLGVFSVFRGVYRALTSGLDSLHENDWSDQKKRKSTKIHKKIYISKISIKILHFLPERRIKRQATHNRPEGEGCRFESL